MRRLNEVPVVHSDPKMDPDHESADEEESDDKNQGILPPEFSLNSFCILYMLFLRLSASLLFVQVILTLMQMSSVDQGIHLLRWEKFYPLQEEGVLLQVTGLVDGKVQVLHGIQVELQE